MSKEPKCALENNRWNIEYQDNNQELEIKPNSTLEAIHIYKCTNCVIKITSKVNVISLINCSGIGLVCEDVIASLEVTNCKKMQLQFGVVPTVQLDNVAGCTCFVQKQNREKSNWVTANSSELNIITLDGDNEPEENPIPQQFISKFVDGKLITEPTDHI